jgi:hypothetical protein
MTQVVIALKGRLPGFTTEQCVTPELREAHVKMHCLSGTAIITPFTLR